MEGILLKESESDDTGNLQRQFLIIRKNVASNQFTISIRELSWLRIAMI